LRKARAKSFSGVFLNLITLGVAICILGLLANIAHTKTDAPITLLKTTIQQVETNIGLVSTESGINAESKPHQPDDVTKKPSKNSETKGRRTAKWKNLRMRVTAYCPCQKCCGKYSDGITACGHKIQPGDTFVAADKQYAFGTEMLIPGYNNNQPVKVLDRGGAIKGNRLDVFFSSHEEALKWGVRDLDVRVYSK
jgi:3D (Asp-Asp-Asp) domain-containing protein